MTRFHQLLGYGGLLPFIGLAILLVSGYSAASYWLITYAALIFSFLGGLLWLASVKVPLPKHVAFVSVALMLWAWCWLLFPAINWFWLAAWSFLGLWLYEKRFIADFYSAPFMCMRLQLTLIAAFSLILAALFQ